MNRRSLQFALLLVLVLTCLILQSSALVSSPSFIVSSSGMITYDPDPPPSNLTWLHTDGIYVKDSQGRIVALRQISCPIWRRVNEAYITNAKAHGFNVINLYFNPEGYRPESHSADFDFNYGSDFNLLDDIIALCKANGVYAGMVWLDSSTGLSQRSGITGWEATANFAINTVWTSIVDRYKSEPTLVGIKIMDEPNWGGTNEWNFWNKTIGTLREINPNLLWFTHAISEQRMGPDYWGSLPWHNPSEVPYPNILMDGGGGYKDGGIWGSWPSDDYAKADEVIATTTYRMQYFRDRVQIPTGTTPYIQGYYPMNNAYSYAAREVARWMEANGYMVNWYLLNHQTKWGTGNEGLACFNELFPDTPYPYYWD